MSVIKEIELAPGFKIPRIITGLWQIADMERNVEDLDPDNTAQYMEDYVNQGFYAFDMADHYGSSEIIAGAYMENYNSEIKARLLTKWVPKPGKITREQVSEAVQRSYSRLRNHPIDLLQFHAWQYAESSWLDGLLFLDELRKEGKVRYLGVTNFDYVHMRIALASGIPLVSNQICYSLLDQRAGGPMTKVCREFGVKILAFGTLAGGFLTDKWLGKKEPNPEDLKTWSEMKYMRFIKAAGGWDVFQNLLSAVKKVALKHEASIANIASRYILESDVVAAVIIGARLGERNHIKENKKILDIVLDTQDIAIIKEAQSLLEPIPGNCGDEYRKPPFLTASGDLSHHLEKFPPIYAVQAYGNNKSRIFSGTPWEDMAGYCRAVRSGKTIHISGTTATHESRPIGGMDPAAQAHFIIDKLEAVLLSFGGSLEDVVRTRIFVKRIEDWEAVALAHGERFKNIQPANTLVQADLVGEEYLVEIEAEAELDN